MFASKSLTRGIAVGIKQVFQDTLADKIKSSLLRPYMTDDGTEYRLLDADDQDEGDDNGPDSPDSPDSPEQARADETRDIV